MPWIILALHSLASWIDGHTDDRHLTTDPACKQHCTPRPGSRLDRASRGVSCTPCMVRRAFNPEWAGQRGETDANIDNALGFIDRTLDNGDGGAWHWRNAEVMEMLGRVRDMITGTDRTIGASEEEGTR